MEDNWFKDWFNTSYYHILYKDRDFDEAKNFINNLLNYLPTKSDSKFLDIACGKGRHALQINNAGFQTAAYDLSEESIKEAHKLEQKGLTFFVHDMRNLFRTNYFDFALNLFTSFGYFKTSRDEQNAILSASKSLKAGGTFVIDFLNSEKVVQNIVPQESKTIEGINFNIQKHIQDNRVHKKITFEVDGKPYSYTEKVKLLKLADFEHYFKKAGLNITAVFGDYDLSDYNPNSNRLIIIANKK